MQVPPVPHLHPYIKHYLWIDKAPALEEQLSIFGDGNPGIVFCCEGRLYMDPLHQLPYPPIFGYGQLSQVRQLYAPGAVRLLIVVLQPFALEALTGIPAWECCDELLQPEEMFTSSSYADLLTAEPLAAKLDAAGKLFSHSFQTSLSKSEALITACISKIRNTSEPLSSGDLTKFSGYSERYLEKLFKQHIGIGPKKFTRITRLLQYTKRLRTAPSLTACAYETGYFDQAHLNHDFKALTGMTPSAYKQHTQTLALNLLAVRSI